MYYQIREIKEERFIWEATLVDTPAGFVFVSFQIWINMIQQTNLTNWPDVRWFKKHGGEKP
eukprot:UN03804